MRLYHLGLLLFCPIGVLLCQSGAPSPGYKLVPDWPAPPRSAPGTPSAWNLSQGPGRAIHESWDFLVPHRGAPPTPASAGAGTLVAPWGPSSVSAGRAIA